MLENNTTKQTNNYQPEKRVLYVSDTNKKHNEGLYSFFENMKIFSGSVGYTPFYRYFKTILGIQTIRQLEDKFLILCKFH